MDGLERVPRDKGFSDGLCQIFHDVVCECLIEQPVICVRVK